MKVCSSSYAQEDSIIVISVINFLKRRLLRNLP